MWLKMINKDIKIIVLVGIFGTIVATVVTLFFNVVCSVVSFLLGVILTLTFYSVTRRRYKKIADLNNYLSLVCAGNYLIDIKDNTEGELSEKDKIYLADSLADISHQLKTPLTSLMVMVDLLKDEKNIDKQKEFISIIEIQISKIKWLVENLLKLSKLDAGTIKFKKEKIDVLSVITKSISPFLVQMEMKNISLETTINDFSFTGDLNWTSEAVENIIKNCIEHTADNGKLNIETGVTNIYSYIKITDNGCGIKKKDLPHIFERFYHCNDSDENSVGIGLALSKAVLLRESADVIVESQLGKGSTFEIRFYKSIV